MIQKIPMRDTVRTGQTQFSRNSVNVTFGRTFVHHKRASYSSQPDVLPGHRTFAHSGSLNAAGHSKSASFLCPPFKRFLSHSSTNPESSFSIPYKVCGFVVCIISSLTQFVNRLIQVFCNLSFLHDVSAAFRPGTCAFRGRV